MFTLVVLVSWFVSLYLVLNIKAAGLRRLFASAILVGFSLSLIYLIIPEWTAIDFYLCLVGGYQILNILRVVENRMNYEHLRKQVARSGFILSLLFLATPLIQVVIDSDIPLLRTQSFLVVMVAIIVASSTIRNLRKSRIVAPKHHYSDEELPTVSYLLPARNEDAQLTECIHSVLKSDYPKLEIIVLDDCSDDSSSDIIKRFAHNGVRFVSGEPPKERWLAKNQAYETLASTASGEWLIFSGVDVEIDKGTIRSIITDALNQKLQMVSVLPERQNPMLVMTILYPLRYFWQIAFPKRMAGHPPTLSTFWVMSKASYKRIGGFSSVARSINPEELFARVIDKKGDYRFLRSSAATRVSTDKSLSEQYETAVRTLYPYLHKKPEAAMLLSLFLMFIGALPLVSAALSFARGDNLSLLLSIIALLFFALSHSLINFAAGQKFWGLTAFSFPFASMQEVALLNYSMIRYEFSEVLWKGRNICFPLMHISSHLPDMDERRETS